MAVNLRVPVPVRHATASGCLALEIELDDHRGLGSDHPSVVLRLDRQHLRRGKLQLAAVRVLDMDLTTRQKTYVRMHAIFPSDNRLHVLRPAKSGRVDHPFDASGAGSHDIQLDATHGTTFTVGYGRYKSILAAHRFP